MVAENDAALGDGVTAGHLHVLLGDPGNLRGIFKKEFQRPPVQGILAGVDKDLNFGWHSLLPESKSTSSKNNLGQPW